MTRDQFAESNQSSQVTYGQEVMFRMEIFLDSRVLKHGEIPILFMYIYPGSQPPFKKWWFLLDDDKPLFKKWWFGNQPIKKGGFYLQGVYIYIYIEYFLDFIIIIIITSKKKRSFFVFIASPLRMFGVFLNC